MPNNLTKKGINTMKHNVAEMIGRKAKALKHCDKVISTIDKQGRTEILLGNTGIVIPCEKNDAIYTMLQSIRFKLVHEINSIEIVSNMRPAQRMLPAPSGACDDVKQSAVCTICGCEITKTGNRQKYCKECAKKMQSEYQRRWRSKQ